MARVSMLLALTTFLGLFSNSVGITSFSTPPATTQPVPVLFTCNFDSSLCGFTQARSPQDDFDWKQKSSSVFSQKTGPKFDHTHGDRSGRFLVAESGYKSTDQNAVIQTGQIISRGYTKICVSYWYYMYGIDMGTLTMGVFIDGTRTAEVNITNNQGNLWKQKAKEVSIPAGSKAVYLSFEAKLQHNVQGLKRILSDIAIDDVSIFAATCSASPVMVTPSRSDVRPITPQTAPPSPTPGIVASAGTVRVITPSQSQVTISQTAPLSPTPGIVASATTSTSGISAECTFKKLYPSEPTGLCGYQNEVVSNQFNWGRKSFRASEGDTGPSGPHDRSGFSDGFMLAKSHSASNGDIAKLRSPIYPQNRSTTGCLTFWFHMWGADMGSLTVRILSSEKGRIGGIFLQGNRGNSWQRSQIPFTSTSTGPTSLEVVFEAKIGNPSGVINPTSDIGIDSVKFETETTCMNVPSSTTMVPASTSSAPPHVTPPLPPNGIVQCNFDYDMCGLSTTGWIREATATGGYIYSTNGGDIFVMTAPETFCVSFTWSYSSPVCQGNTVKLVYQTTSGNPKETPISVTDSGNTAPTQAMDIDLPFGADNVQLVFEKNSMCSGSSKLKIDNLLLKKTFCNGATGTTAVSIPPTTTLPLRPVPVLFTCNFDTRGNWCGFTQVRPPQDNFDWTQRTTKLTRQPTGPSVDHTQGDLSGRFMMAEAVYKPTDQMAVIKTGHILTGGHTKLCVNYWYHMYGAHMGSLTMRVYAAETQNKEVYIVGDQGNQWRRKAVDVSFSAGDPNYFSLSFEAKLQHDVQGFTRVLSDFAIDDVSVFAAPCSASPAMVEPSQPQVTAPTASLPKMTGSTTRRSNPSTPSATPSLPITPDPSLPPIVYSCNFESRTLGCGMYQSVAPVDTFDWTFRNSKIHPYNTGPSFDHTLGSGKMGYFALADPGYKPSGSSANLVTARIPIQRGLQVCVRFYYYLAGVDMGTFRASVSSNNVALERDFSVTGNQGDNWIKRDIDIPAPTYDGTYLILSFTSTLNHSVSQLIRVKSDMAIDDIIVSSSTCQQLPDSAYVGLPPKFPPTTPKPTSPSVPNQSPSPRPSAEPNGAVTFTPLPTIATLPPPKNRLVCTFDEVDDCGWYQDKTDDFDWTPLRTPTWTNNTGPREDSTGNKGVYLYTRSQLKRNGSLARIIIPDIQAPAGRACLHFHYHMYGRDMGTLRVVHSQVNMPDTVVWKLTGDQGDSWKEAAVNISLQGGILFDLVFVAELSYVPGFLPKRLGDMALDDIVVRPNYYCGIGNGGSHDSCSGRCGMDYSVNYTCHCNSICKDYKDCCDDYDQFCLSAVSPHKSPEPKSHMGVIIGVCIGCVLVVGALVAVLLIARQRQWAMFNPTSRLSMRFMANKNDTSVLYSHDASKADTVDMYSNDVYGNHYTMGPGGQKSGQSSDA